MTNPTIQTDLAEILKQMKDNQEKLLEAVHGLQLGQARIEGRIDAIDEKLSGQINSVDGRLSGQIEILDQKLSGKIDVLEQKISGQKEIVEKTTAQLDKRIANQEVANRVILGGFTLTILGGIASYFGWIGKP